MLYLCTSLFLNNSNLWDVINFHSRIYKHTSSDGSACIVLNLTSQADKEHRLRKSTMVYLEQALPPYIATPAGCSLRQRYPYHPIPLEKHTVPHWDVKTKRPQPVLPFVIMSQCGKSNKLALQQANFVPYDRLLQKPIEVRETTCAMWTLPHPPPLLTNAKLRYCHVRSDSVLSLCILLVLLWFPVGKTR